MIYSAIQRYYLPCGKLPYPMKFSLLITFCALSTLLRAQSDLVINEFVASNDSTSMIADQDGDYDDWIELHNQSGLEITLSGYMLSDDAAEPDKWSFPVGTVIPANGYLIVWADKDDEQEGLHADFKLAKDGEHIVLSNEAGVVLDSISFPEQQTNVSYARIPNGTGPFAFADTPTFDATNGTSSLFTPAPDDFGAVLFPVPVRTQLSVEFERAIVGEAEAQIISPDGRIVRSRTVRGAFARFDLSDLPTGTYRLHIRGAGGRQSVRSFTVGY